MRESTQEAPREKFVPLGLDAPDRTVGLTGLCPLAVLALPPARLRREPGILRVWMDLPQGCELAPGSPLTYRVRGGEAGLEFERDGEIVTLRDVHLPLDLPYAPRRGPAAPPAAEMSLDLSFWYRMQGDAGAGTPQDVQWRVPIVWDKRGKNVIELGYALRPGSNPQRASTGV